MTSCTVHDITLHVIGSSECVRRYKRHIRLTFPSWVIGRFNIQGHTLAPHDPELSLAVWLYEITLPGVGAAVVVCFRSDCVGLVVVRGTFGRRLINLSVFRLFPLSDKIKRRQNLGSFLWKTGFQKSMSVIIWLFCSFYLFLQVCPPCLSFCSVATDEQVTLEQTRNITRFYLDITVSIASCFCLYGLDM